LEGTVRARLTWDFLAAAVAMLLLTAAGDVARAQVVAFGASVVMGYGVAPADAYPAQLEAMLRARGVSVSVRNAGVYGDTSQAMLARLDRNIPPGTKVVVLDTSGELLNNYVAGISQEQGQTDIATMTARLTARRIVVIPESTRDIPPNLRQPDGKHLTSEGNRVVAARLLDSVIQALRSAG
jgi:acyl-CoA thioesterase-1